MPHFVRWGLSFSGIAWGDATKARRSKSLFNRKCLRSHRLRDQTTTRDTAVTASGARQYTLSCHGPPESTRLRLTIAYKTDLIAPENRINCILALLISLYAVTLIGILGLLLYPKIQCIHRPPEPNTQTQTTALRTESVESRTGEQEQNVFLTTYQLQRAD